MDKTSVKSTRSKNQHLYIFDLLKKGFSPSQISKVYNINKYTLQNHLTTLKNSGRIKKVGYGTWEIVPEKEVLLSTRLATINPQLTNTSFPPDSVRGHAFQFTFSIPKNFRNWEKRRDILQKLEIAYKPLPIFGGAEQIKFKDKKVWLTNKSIIIFEKASYLAQTSKEAKSYAISEALETIKAIEGYLKANLGTYRFRVSRQHYSLIKNALAKQYDKEGKKLEVYCDSGLWFLIDNSFNLHEAETLHPKTSDLDNKKIQDFFNGIKEYEGFTPKFLMDSLGGLVTNWHMYSGNIVLHIKAIQDLGANVKRYNEGWAEISEVLKQLKEVIKK